MRIYSDARLRPISGMRANTQTYRVAASAASRCTKTRSCGAGQRMWRPRGNARGLPGPQRRDSQAVASLAGRSGELVTDMTDQPNLATDPIWAEFEAHEIDEALTPLAAAAAVAARGVFDPVAYAEFEEYCDYDNAAGIDDEEDDDS
jgi:hypothetical protein